VPTFPAAVLQELATNLLAAAGVSREEAAINATGLVGANLRGHDSHGVMRLPSYVKMIETKEAIPGQKLTILEEGPSRLAADGNWGLGRTLALELTNRLIAKAKVSGLAAGTIVKSSHVGRLGDYCEIATDQGFVALMTVNSHGAVHRVAPPGGKASRLSTNPIAFAAPHPSGALICDFSTSATAEGKVRVKKIAGEKCPEGWLIDSNGEPTTNPNDLYDAPGGAILPMGGPQMYKGFGLALMVEILSGALSGGLCSRAKAETQIGNCVFLLLLNPAGFGGAECFAKEVDGLMGWVRSCPTAAGVDRIVIPGDPERHVLSERSAKGVPIEAENWKQIVDLAKRLKVAVPG